MREVNSTMISLPVDRRCRPWRQIQSLSTLLARRTTMFTKHDDNNIITNFKKTKTIGKKKKKKNGVELNPQKIRSFRVREYARTIRDDETENYS